MTFTNQTLNEALIRVMTNLADAKITRVYFNGFSKSLASIPGGLPISLFTGTILNIFNPWAWKFFITNASDLIFILKNHNQINFAELLTKQSFLKPLIKIVNDNLVGALALVKKGADSIVMISSLYKWWKNGQGYNQIILEDKVFLQKSLEEVLNILNDNQGILLSSELAEITSNFFANEKNIKELQDNLSNYKNTYLSLTGYDAESLQKNFNKIKEGEKSSNSKNLEARKQLFNDQNNAENIETLLDKIADLEKQIKELRAKKNLFFLDGLKLFKERGFRFNLSNDQDFLSKIFINYLNGTNYKRSGNYSLIVNQELLKENDKEIALLVGDKKDELFKKLSDAGEAFIRISEKIDNAKQQYPAQEKLKKLKIEEEENFAEVAKICAEYGISEENSRIVFINKLSHDHPNLKTADTRLIEDLNRDLKNLKRAIHTNDSLKYLAKEEDLIDESEIDNETLITAEDLGRFTKEIAHYINNNSDKFLSSLIAYIDFNSGNKDASLVLAANLTEIFGDLKLIDDILYRLDLPPALEALIFASKDKIIPRINDQLKAANFSNNLLGGNKSWLDLFVSSLPGLIINHSLGILSNIRNINDCKAFIANLEIDTKPIENNFKAFKNTNNKTIRDFLFTEKGRNSFNNCNLSKEDLSGYNFEKLNFWQTDLTEVNFNNASFVRTNFTQAKIEKATFIKAKFDFYSFKSLINDRVLNPEIFKEATVIVNSQTITAPELLAIIKQHEFVGKRINTVKDIDLNIKIDEVTKELLLYTSLGRLNSLKEAFGEQLNSEDLKKFGITKERLLKLQDNSLNSTYPIYDLLLKNAKILKHSPNLMRELFNISDRLTNDNYLLTNLLKWSNRYIKDEHYETTIKNFENLQSLLNVINESNLQQFSNQDKDLIIQYILSCDKSGENLKDFIAILQTPQLNCIKELYPELTKPENFIKNLEQLQDFAKKDLQLLQSLVELKNSHSKTDIEKNLKEAVIKVYLAEDDKSKALIELGIINQVKEKLQNSEGLDEKITLLLQNIAKDYAQETWLEVLSNFIRGEAKSTFIDLLPLLLLDSAMLKDFNPLLVKALTEELKVFYSNIIRLTQEEYNFIREETDKEILHFLSQPKEVIRLFLNNRENLKLLSKDNKLLLLQMDSNKLEIILDNINQMKSYDIKDLQDGLKEEQVLQYLSITNKRKIHSINFLTMHGFTLDLIWELTNEQLDFLAKVVNSPAKKEDLIKLVKNSEFNKILLDEKISKIVINAIKDKEELVMALVEIDEKNPLYKNLVVTLSIKTNAKIDCKALKNRRLIDKVNEIARKLSDQTNQDKNLLAAMILVTFCNNTAAINQLLEADTFIENLSKGSQKLAVSHVWQQTVGTNNNFLSVLNKETSGKIYGHNNITLQDIDKLKLIMNGFEKCLSEKSTLQQL
jgi:uncharacterized protein YjbI with pentapeptide repeats